MKKLGYFLLLLIILSACTSGETQTKASDLPVSNSVGVQEPLDALPVFPSGANQTTTSNQVVVAPRVDEKPVDDVMARDFWSSPSPTMKTDPFADPQSGLAISQIGNALTPFQHQLEKAINQRKAAGLPVPSSVKFEYQATSDDAMQQIAGAAKTSIDPVKVVSKTVISFAGPEQAGYDEWPPLIVKDNLPLEAYGTVKEGDYSDAYRKFMEEKIPGFWEKYEFGHEPRTHTIVETIEITYPEKKLLAPNSIISTDLTSTEDILMGFTYTGPHLNYAIEDGWGFEICVPFTDICDDIEIYYFKAGFELDWGLGLRLPGQANLIGPDQMILGSSYSLSSVYTPLDWSPTNYSNVGVAPEDGNEFVLRMNFFVGVEGHLLGADLCPWCHVTLEKDFSTSFTTPFGSGAFFPIPPVDIPIYEFDLAIFYFGAGLEVDPNLGSDKITANWKANGDASGNGTINYSGPGTPVSFGSINACNLGPDNLAQIQVDGFHYWFNQFLIEISAALNFQLFGYGVWNPTYSIISLDLSSLSDDMYLGSHTQCDWDFDCSAVGPDNTLSLSIPVVDLAPPITSLTITGTEGNNGWYISDVSVSLIASDEPAGCGVGVNNTEYSFDGTTWTAYTGPFTISNEGITTVYYHSTDNEDNVEATKTQDIKVDKTQPVITGAPTTSPNAYGWYNTDVVVHFEAYDAVSGIDTVTPDQTLAAEGANQSVTGTAVDVAGHSASYTVTGINIDKTSPSISITSPEASIYENTETFTVIWSATDSLSGIASESGAMDGIAVTNGQLINLLIFTPGLHIMEVEAMDKADNLASASVGFNVTVDSEGLLDALEYMCDLGWIEKQGICNSLEAKLIAAIASIDRGNLNAAENQLNSFLHELEAQQDKSINQSAYDVLNTGALYVIEHLYD